MYEKVEWMLTKSGEREIKESGASKEFMANRLLKAINDGSLPYKEFIPGLYKGSPCPHTLHVERLSTGTYIIYAGFMGYVLEKGDILTVIDIHDIFGNLSVRDVNKVIRGIEVPNFDIKAALREKLKRPLHKQGFLQIPIPVNKLKIY